MTRPTPLERTVLAVALRVSALTAGVLSGCGDDGGTSDTSGTGGARASSTASTSTASSSTGDGGGSVASCGPVVGLPPSEACTTCSWAHCCDEVAACSSAPTCSGFASCIQPCGDDAACIDACAVLNWGDSPQSLDLYACQLEHCGAECGVAERRCDLLFAPPNAGDRDGCQDCLASTCCEEHQAISDPEVVAFGQCSLRCAEPACLRACELAHPRGVAAFDALQTCIGATCRPVLDPAVRPHQAPRAGRLRFLPRGRLLRRHRSVPGRPGLRCPADLLRLVRG